MSTSDLAIRAVGVSKEFRIGPSNMYPTLREALAGRVSDWMDRVRRGAEAAEERQRSTFRALDDVSFDVRSGEVLGIIGRNGAGKSTLLKILSRITEPTSGYVEIYGRLGCLLEVGTGFHPELTGRENIYLNGAVLGMSRAEVTRKFDEIVEFAGVQQFLDTPVKRYSSGMYVRLAFAVAAHLEPDILLVDEVLAVGDVDFQKKCIGSMQSVAKSGRTVVIISHNMALIESLCSRAMWLDGGKVRASGGSAAVVEGYLSASRLLHFGDLSDRPNGRQMDGARFTGIEIIGEDSGATHDVAMGEPLTFHLKLEVDRPIPQPWVAIQIRTAHDQLVFHAANREAGFELGTLSGEQVVTCRIETQNLLPDRYYVDLILADMTHHMFDEVVSATYFDIRSRDVLGTGMPMNNKFGLVYFPSRWTLRDATSRVSQALDSN